MTASTPVPKATAIAALDGLLRFARTRLAKASTPAALAARDSLIADNLAEFEADLAEYFRGLAERNLPDLATEVAKALRAIPEPDEWDWEGEAGLLRRILGRWYVLFGEAAYAQAGPQLGLDLRFDIEQPGVTRVMDQLASRVKGITETSRTVLVDLVTEARRTGLSVDNLERQLGATFESWTRSRAHAVALTESATAYNLSSAAAWRDSGIVETVRIFDGDGCGWKSHNDPDLAHGSVRTLEEYQAQPLSHPNCQRAASPVPIRATPEPPPVVAL